MARAKELLVAAMIANVCGCGSDVAPIAGDLVASITLQTLPGEVSINQAATPDGRVEYFWMAVFDVNDSGTLDEGDLSLMILQYKHTGASEETAAVDELPASLWRYRADLTIAREAAITTQVIGDTIYMAADRAAFAALGDITATTGVFFETLYYDSVTNAQYIDDAPAQGMFQNLSASSPITDPSNDVANINNGGVMSFPLIDITEATVLVR